MDFSNLITTLNLFQAPAGTAEAAEGGSQNMLMQMGSMPIMLIAMVAMIYFLFIRPESKRKKKAEQMLANIQIADEVVTSGGIIGRVIDAKPDSDTIVIETGGDKTRIRILKSHIIENRTVHDDA